ncbi:Pol polyprotein [Lonchura striata]|uniref:ribonuclease H n=1 Tax=Lonchura striata TaxID=40157 RepID=A0A218UVZ0_9PASE|nr:Pol polyprotein [Lonchura striata domestica]
MSPHNTPILAVRKAEGKYRLVQDLREVNKRTIARHPTVPDPYTLLNKIPYYHAWFTVVDLKDAFWACPLATECRDWFAFQWENIEGNRRMQLRWTRLPQGFCDSPNLFGQTLEKILEAFTSEEGVQVLQYVDDLLISGKDQERVRRTSIRLLNYLGEIGLKVSRNKLQFMESQVTYLGHIIGPGYKKLSPERISGIVSLPAPKTKRDIRKLLGLFGYCKLWIDSYTQKVKFLYDKLVLPDLLEWTEKDDEKLGGLKQALISAPVLGLPDLKREFHLFVNIDEGIAHGVLAQEWAGSKKPIAYLSKLLDPVARGWPTCLQAIAATALIVEEAQKLTFQGKTKVYTPHDIKGTLSQGAHKWLSDARILKYEIVLMNSDNLELTTAKVINPAQFLSGEPASGFEHYCVDVISLQTKSYRPKQARCDAKGQWEERPVSSWMSPGTQQGCGGGDMAQDNLMSTETGFRPLGTVEGASSCQASCPLPSPSPAEPSARQGGISLATNVPSEPAMDQTHAKWAPQPPLPGAAWDCSRLQLKGHKNTTGLQGKHDSRIVLMTEEYSLSKGQSCHGRKALSKAVPVRQTFSWQTTSEGTVMAGFGESTRTHGLTPALSREQLCTCTCQELTLHPAQSSAQEFHSSTSAHSTNTKSPAHTLFPYQAHFALSSHALFM